MNLKMKKILGIIIVLFLALILTIELGACSADKAKEDKNPTEVALGTLYKKAPNQVKDSLGYLINEAEELRIKREKSKDYKPTEKEIALWEQINGILNGETIVQKGSSEYSFDNGSPEGDDFYFSVIDKLKAILSEEDWTKLDEILKAIEENDFTYGEKEVKEIDDILKNYPEVDSMATVMNLQIGEGERNLAFYSISEGDKIELKDPNKSMVEPISEENREQYKKIWEGMKNILPSMYLKNFSYFIVNTDGEYGLFAAVVPEDFDGKNWCIYVDPKDWDENSEEAAYTIVHEYAHYLSLNNNQVDYFKDEIGYFPLRRYADEFCVAKKKSYIQGFYEKFWKNIELDNKAMDENPYFYMRHEDEFVTEYAATNCAEDFAETFACYVLDKNPPKGKIKEKFKYMDSFPELREVKKEILKQRSQK